MSNEWKSHADACRLANEVKCNRLSAFAMFSGTTIANLSVLQFNECINAVEGRRAFTMALDVEGGVRSSIRRGSWRLPSSRPLLPGRWPNPLKRTEAGQSGETDGDFEVNTIQGANQLGWDTRMLIGFRLAMKFSRYCRTWSLISEEELVGLQSHRCSPPPFDINYATTWCT